MMNVNKWTMGLAAVGLVSIPAIGSAEEQMNQVWTALSSTTLSGYVNTSIHWNPGTGNANVPGYSFNSVDKQDGFNLNVVKLALEKPLDEAQWAAGYKAELLFGQDAALLGTANAISKGATPEDVTIKQAYVSLRTPVGNGLDFKVGVWDTIIGYETFDAGSNPNYTRSYGYTLEPTTHTGVHGRGEYAWTGTGLLGTGNVTSGNSEVFALTGTLQYDLWKNVLSRLEVRVLGGGGGTSEEGISVSALTEQEMREQ